MHQFKKSYESDENKNFLRILMVANGTPAIPPLTAGGLEFVIFYLTKWLSKLGHSVTLIDTFSDEERDKTVKMDNCDFIKLNHFNFSRFHRRKTNYLMHELMRQISMLTFSLKLFTVAPKLFSSKKYDVIHVHYRYTFVALWVAKKILNAKIPIVFHCHNAWMSRQRIPFYLRFFWFFDTFAFHKADMTIVLSKPMQYGLTHFHRAPSNQIIVIPNGVDLIKNSIFASNHSATPETIVCVANIMPLKNQEILIDAFINLSARFKNLKLFLIGEIVDEKYYQKLCSKIDLHKLAAKIIFTGGISHSQVLDILSKSHIAVLPSKFEAMSMAALEYLSAGVPTLLSRIPAMTSMYDVGTVLFFDPSETSELMSLLCELMLDEQLRKRLSTNGRKFVTLNYGWQSVCKKIESLYFDLLGRNCFG